MQISASPMASLPQPATQPAPASQAPSNAARSVFNTIDSVLNVPMQLVKNPGRVVAAGVAALAMLGSPAAARSVPLPNSLPNAAPSNTSTTAVSPLDTAAEAYIGRFNDCIHSIRNANADDANKVAHCAGNAVYTGHQVRGSDKGQHLLLIRDRAPAPGSEGAVAVTLAERAMHKDAPFPSTNTAEQIVEMAIDDILQSPWLHQLEAKAAEGVAQDCNVHARVDDTLNDKRDVEEMFDREACAHKHIDLIERGDVRRAIANLFFLTEEVPDLKTARRALAQNHHEDAHIHEANDESNQRIIDEVARKAHV